MHGAVGADAGNVVDDTSMPPLQPVDPLYHLMTGVPALSPVQPPLTKMQLWMGGVRLAAHAPHEVVHEVVMVMGVPAVPAQGSYVVRNTPPNLSPATLPTTRAIRMACQHTRGTRMADTGTCNRCVLVRPV